MEEEGVAQRVRAGVPVSSDAFSWFRWFLAYRELGRSPIVRGERRRRHTLEAVARAIAPGACVSE
ncbi:hypothetical protein IQ267_26575 [filamentous cyanobacterium LEGE 07170]|nr:hypothetical protein [filamentous cyanobacterium LEGE 07170]